MKRVYIAGPLSDMPADYLANCACMIAAWREVNALGHAGYCPATDMMLGASHDLPYTIEQYQAWSMAWLEAADVVLVIASTHRDGRPSKGVLTEVERAADLGIPVVFSIDELRALE